jgi:hypothetical protein
MFATHHSPCALRPLSSPSYPTPPVVLQNASRRYTKPAAGLLHHSCPFVSFVATPPFPWRIFLGVLGVLTFISRRRNWPASGLPKTFSGTGFGPFLDVLWTGKGLAKDSPPCHLLAHHLSPPLPTSRIPTPCAAAIPSPHSPNIFFHPPLECSPSSRSLAELRMADLASNPRFDETSAQQV